MSRDSSKSKNSAATTVSASELAELSEIVENSEAELSCDELRDAVEAGEYEVDAKRLAAAMLTHQEKPLSREE